MTIIILSRQELHLVVPTTLTYFGNYFYPDKRQSGPKIMTNLTKTCNYRNNSLYVYNQVTWTMCNVKMNVKQQSFVLFSPNIFGSQYF
jgi:hypothetical protein